MAQGKARDKEKTFEVLKPFFKLGCSVNKACNYAGIPNTTVHTWLEKDETLRMKIKGWQNEINLAARKVWSDEIKAQKDFDASKNWLERKEKKEFSTRTEQAVEGEQTLIIEHKEIDE